MATYEVTTENGIYQVETESKQTQENKTIIQKAPEGTKIKKLPEEQLAKEQISYQLSQGISSKTGQPISPETFGIPVHEVIRMNLVENPKFTGIMREPKTSELLQSQMQLYGTALLGAGMVVSPIATLKGLVGATIGYKLGELAKPAERLTPENASSQTKDMAKTADMLLSSLLAYGGYKASSALLNKMPAMGLGKYAQNKALAIRKGGLKVYSDMQVEYGKDLDSLATNPEKVDATNTIGVMEELVRQRMPESFSSTGDKIKAPPANRVDNALLRSYNRIYAKWANSKDGAVTVGDIVSELKQIKDSGGIKPSSLSRLATQIQRDILGAIKGDIDIPKFQEMQTKYHTGMNELEAMDKHFDIWNDNPYMTEKGERFIKTGVYKSEEAKGIAKLVTEKTGQTLKGAKILSRTNQVVGSKLLRYLLYAYGVKEAGELATNLGKSNQ